MVKCQKRGKFAKDGCRSLVEIFTLNTEPHAQQTMFAELFNTFLSLAGEAYAGKAVLAFYAPDALVAFGGKVQKRKDVDETEYAWAFAEFETFGPDALGKDAVSRPFIGDAQCQKIVQASAHQTVVWFSCSEPSTDVPLVVATGWEWHAGRPALAWMTVSEDWGDWTFEHGRMMAAGDAAYLDGSCFLTPRSWLDLGWYRVHGHRRPKLIIPDGARFACHSSGDCCRIGFEIKVPAHAQQVIDAIPWEQHAPHLQGTQLPETDDGKVWLKRPGENCRFLDENSHCRIHKIFGRAVFEVCATYPLFFVETPDGVDVWGAQTCSSFRLGLGPKLEDREAHLYSRLAFRPQKTEFPQYFINESSESSDWRRFRLLENALVSNLAREDLRLVERLRRCQEMLDIEAPSSSARDSFNQEQLKELQHGWSDTLQSWVGLFIGQQKAFDPRRQTLMAIEESNLASLLRQHLLSKRVSGKYGLRIAHHLNVVLFRSIEAAILELAPPNATLPQNLWWEINSTAQHRDTIQKLLLQRHVLEWLGQPALIEFLLSDYPLTA